MREINIFIDSSLDVLDNYTVRFMFISIIIIYSIIIIPILDNKFYNILNNNIFKLLLFLFIIYIGTKDSIISILIISSYLLSLIHLNNKFENNSYDNIQNNIIENNQNDTIKNNLQSFISNKSIKNNINDLNNINNINNINDVNNNINNINDINNINNNNDVNNINDNNCLNQCTRDNNLNKNDLTDQCTPISAFNNDLNAQGLNCPLGNDNIINGALF